MLIPSILVSIAAVGLFLIVNKISTDRATKIRHLESKKVVLHQRFEFMIKQRSELRREIEDKERELATIRNSQHGINPISASDLDIEDIDENEKVSRYFIQEGKITLEQNEKILKKMGIMQMDYIGTCLALGFININTAKKAIKINKITSLSEGLN